MRSFLGQSGAATVVLLESPDKASLPKSKDIKQFLGVGAPKIFKGEGWFRYEIAQLESALNILKGSIDTLPWRYVTTTDYLLLPPGIKRQIFFELKYSPIILEGFDLTDACMIDLGHKLRLFREVKNWRNDVQNFYENLESRASKALERNVQDPSVLQPDVGALKKILHGYGENALLNITQEIVQWHATYKW